VQAQSAGVTGKARQLAQRFAGMFGGPPMLFRAPGRINLIGEHTDYNDGFVMPAAIDFSTWVAIRAQDRRSLRIHSENFRETVEIQLDELRSASRKHWSDYVRGVAAILADRTGLLESFDLLIDSEVPPGAGLSSSAALEVSVAVALSDTFGLGLSRLDLVKASQRAEHEYAGTRCGIMDQYISAFGLAGHALLLDCRSLQSQAVTIADRARIAVCNSMVRHEHAGGEYNRRRAECEAGVQVLQTNRPELRSLRDATIDDLQRNKSDLPEVVFRRCRHVITENQRTLETARALRDGDFHRVGQLMNASHASLRDDYEVSCRELDVLAALAQGATGVYGSRMMGGGFGGCTVTLVEQSAVAALRETLSAGYQKATGIIPEIYVCTTADGASAVSI
jgi:galactokinase